MKTLEGYIPILHNHFVQFLDSYNILLTTKKPLEMNHVQEDQRYP